MQYERITYDDGSTLEGEKGTLPDYNNGAPVARRQDIAPPQGSGIKAAAESMLEKLAGVPQASQEEVSSSDEEISEQKEEP